MHLTAQSLPRCDAVLLRSGTIRSLNLVQTSVAARNLQAACNNRAAVRTTRTETRTRNAAFSTRSKLQAVPWGVSPLASVQSLSAFSGTTLLEAEVVVTALLALLITAYNSRPRGWCDHSLVQVRVVELSQRLSLQADTEHPVRCTARMLAACASESPPAGSIV